MFSRVWWLWWLWFSTGTELSKSRGVLIDIRVFQGGIIQIIKANKLGCSLSIVTDYFKSWSPSSSSILFSMWSTRTTSLSLTKQKICVCLPMKTEQKKKVMGMFTIGADIFRNQLGVMGKNLRKSKKKNRQSWFSSTWKIRTTDQMGWRNLPRQAVGVCHCSGPLFTSTSHAQVNSSAELYQEPSFQSVTVK